MSAYMMSFQCGRKMLRNLIDVDVVYRVLIGVFLARFIHTASSLKAVRRVFVEGLKVERSPRN